MKKVFFKTLLIPISKQAATLFLVCLFSVFAGYAQTNISIRGKVVDANNNPIVGAAVMEKGTANGVLSSNNGEFAFTVSPGAVLEVSFVGYADQDVPVGNQTNITITMTDDVHSMEEVVVVGYGVQKKVNLTGSIATVKADDINSIPVGNLSNALAGRAPGVTITGTSGFAGASSDIRMRGSFGEPLYVINNVIRGKADFDALDPNEVESINFLKDAASASIYGSKAGNGVVLVTTKTGKSQKPTIQYKATVTTMRTTKSVQDYSATDELIWNNRLAETKGRAPLYAEGGEVFQYFADKSYNVNDYVWQNPFAHQHNISVDGGSDRVNYFLSAGYHSEDGSYKTVKYDKMNFRSDITVKITDDFKVNFNLSGNKRDYKRFYWPYDGAEDMNLPDFYRTTFNWTRLYPFYVDDDGNPTTNTSANPVTSGAWNPVEMVVGNRYQKINKRTFDGQIRFDWDMGKLVEGLKVAFQGQYTGYDHNQKQFITHNKGYRFKSASATNPFLPGPIDPNDVVVHNLSSSYEGIKEWGRFDNSYQINWFVNYDRTFGRHGISALAVYEQGENKNKSINGEAMGLLTSSVDQIFAASQDTQRRYFNGQEWETARKSWIGRLNYSYDERYVAEFSFRYDGNYKFASGERWGFFPSGSFAWNINKESFMKNVSWLNVLKLRGSYGSTGDDNQWNGNELGAFGWRDKFSNASTSDGVGRNGYIIGDTYYRGLMVGATPNPYITWAKLESFDIGFDYAVLDYRLTGDFSYFVKKKSDILASRTTVVPGTYGAPLAAENYAKQEWRGFETSIRWSDSYKDFKYSVYANMGYSKDKWTKYDEAEGLEPWRSKIGKPNNRHYGYIAEGIIRTQEQLDALPAGYTQWGRTPMLGTILYRDFRGAGYSEGADNKIDSNDMTFLSDKANPRINYGFGFNLEWKGISLDAHFQGVGSYDRMIATNSSRDGGVFQVADKPYFQMWTGNNVWTPENPNAKYPRITGDWVNGEHGGQPSTFWLQNGSFCRLKNLNVAYTFPKKWMSKAGIGSLQVFFNGTNLFYISKMKLMDPEQKYLDSFPLMKTYTGGISITF